jgi:hypothetical protein
MWDAGRNEFNPSSIGSGSDRAMSPVFQMENTRARNSSQLTYQSTDIKSSPFMRKVNPLIESRRFKDPRKNANRLNLLINNV